MFLPNTSKKSGSVIDLREKGPIHLSKELCTSLFTIVISSSGTAGLAESVWESVGEWLGLEEGGDLNSWIGKIQGGWERQLEVGSFVL